MDVFTFSTPLNPLSIRLQEGKVAEVALLLGSAKLKPTPLSALNPQALETKQQLDAYFQGRLTEFDLPMEPEGTPFQKKVWKALSTIPYGSTISYQELAEKVGSPKGCRAVGNANGKNPLPILIPCHRVISKNGSLGGYSGGLHWKQFLLSLEGS